ncbi:MAG TPA: HNH endonuclease signature motif containing protein [Candidatus Acidoferrum sp.]|nr:HNH endonuclease signature motif containing protein [Candidatus Acidoferrum sp.]
MLTILWNEDDESAGYTETIPSDWFSSQGFPTEGIHDVFGPRSGRYKAKCTISAKENVTYLDYRPFERFNSSQGMLIGVLRIQFTTSARKSVFQLAWQQKGDRVFRPCSASTWLDPESSKEFEAEVLDSSELSPGERRRRLAAASKKPQQLRIITIGFRRNPDVVAEVLFRAGGKCERCNRRAPFRRASDGRPYLEVHHSIRLADGGNDTVENAIALCPNCHRKAHYGLG